MRPNSQCSLALYKWFTGTYLPFSMIFGGNFPQLSVNCNNVQMASPPPNYVSTLRCREWSAVYDWMCLVVYITRYRRAGGRHDMPPPRPATEACSGSIEPGRPSRARSANTHHPAGRPHTPPADRDRRQTDVRQHHRLMLPGRGHNKCRESLSAVQ